MPNSRSAFKRMRSDARKHAQNQTLLTELSTRQKKLLTLAKKDLEAAKTQARVLISKLDKAVSRGAIPHKRADRKKARIGKLLSKK
jgi:small subunit ribosomal protein S20